MKILTQKIVFETRDIDYCRNYQTVSKCERCEAGSVQYQLKNVHDYSGKNKPGV